VIIIDEEKIFFFTETGFEEHDKDKIIKMTSEEVVGSFCEYVDFFSVETTDNIIDSVEDLPRTPSK